MPAAFYCERKADINQMTNNRNKKNSPEWLLCPVCHSKTRIKIRPDTEFKKFPLFCPKCRRETLINVEKLNISVIREPDALDAEPANS